MARVEAAEATLLLTTTAAAAEEDELVVLTLVFVLKVVAVAEELAFGLLETLLEAEEAALLAFWLKLEATFEAELAREAAALALALVLEVGVTLEAELV